MGSESQLERFHNLIHEAALFDRKVARVLFGRLAFAQLVQELLRTAAVRYSGSFVGTDSGAWRSADEIMVEGVAVVRAASIADEDVVVLFKEDTPWREPEVRVGVDVARGGDETVVTVAEMHLGRIKVLDEGTITAGAYSRAVAIMARCDAIMVAGSAEGASLESKLNIVYLVLARELERYADEREAQRKIGG